MEDKGDLIKETFEEIISHKAVQLAKKGLKNLSLTHLEYALFFVASAIQGQATFIDTYTLMERFVLEHNAKLPPVEMFQQLAGNILPLTAPSQLHSLNTALQHAREAGVGLITCNIWYGGKKGLSLYCTPTELKITPIDEPPFTNKRATWQIVMGERAKLRQAFKMLNRITGQGLLPEAEIILERCKYAPIPITISGSTINEAVDLYPCLAWKFLEPAEPSVHHPGLKARTPRNAFNKRTSSTTDLTAVFALGVEDPNINGLYLVTDGVLWCYRKQNPTFPNSTIIAHVPGLSFPPRDGEDSPSLRKIIHQLEQELLDLAEAILTEIKDVPANKTEQAAQILRQLADYYSSREAPDKLEQIYQASLYLQEKSVSSSDEELLELRLKLASYHLREGNTSKARELYQQVIPIYEKTSENHLAKYRYSEAITFKEKALQLMSQVTDQTDTQLAAKYLELAELCREHRDHRAEPFYKEAITRLEKADPVNVKLLADAMAGLADLYRTQKLYSQAEIYAQKAINILEDSHGESPILVPYLKLLGQILEAKGDYGASTDLMSRALALRFKRT